MPRAKKQKTTRDSDVPAQGHNSRGSDPAIGSTHTGETDKEDRSQNAYEPEPYQYVCIPRPYFDVKNEYLLRKSNDEPDGEPDSEPDSEIEDEEDKIWKLYVSEFDQGKKDGLYTSPPEEHPEHKWVMLCNAWVQDRKLDLKAKYCNPDNFGMYICNDWHSWGIQENVENMMLDFNKAYRSKGPKRLADMWVVVSALGLRLNQGDYLGTLMMSDAGDEINELFRLIGCALLTVLATIEKAGELKPDSCFLDLALVMGYYFEFSHDLPAYGIEGDSVAWRIEAVNYFKKANLDPAKALCTTKQRMDRIEKLDDYDQPREPDDATKATKQTSVGNSAENPAVTTDGKNAQKETTDPQDRNDESRSPKSLNGKRKRGSLAVQDIVSKVDAKEEDTWDWVKTFKAYKQERGPVMGGQKHDITKMSRAERARAAFDGKDPLADVPVKELKNDQIDIE